MKRFWARFNQIESLYVENFGSGSLQTNNKYWSASTLHTYECQKPMHRTHTHTHQSSNSPITPYICFRKYTIDDVKTWLAHFGTTRIVCISNSGRFFELFARALSLSRSHGALTMIQLLHASQTDEEPNGHEIRVNLSFVMNWIDINGNDAISSWIHYTLKQHPNTQLSRLCVRIDCWCGFSFCLSTEKCLHHNWSADHIYLAAYFYISITH